MRIETFTLLLIIVLLAVQSYQASSRVLMGNSTEVNQIIFEKGSDVSYAVLTQPRALWQHVTVSFGGARSKPITAFASYSGYRQSADGSVYIFTVSSSSPYVIFKNFTDLRETKSLYFTFKRSSSDVGYQEIAIASIKGGWGTEHDKPVPVNIFMEYLAAFIVLIIVGTLLTVVLPIVICILICCGCIACCGIGAKAAASESRPLVQREVIHVTSHPQPYSHYNVQPAQQVNMYPNPNNV
ncbi:hypothetical protein AKO1_000312 [Acrasis kona]|uniref:Uncharacterized protein n=1 Tax=Acrasis kona TaxID=1008807 RepID=A0AAW2ZCN1_9EUKA